MKRKSLLAIALITCISSNAFSMNIVKGKILEHKQFSTNNTPVTATFQESNFDKNKLTTLLNMHSGDENLYIQSNTHANKVKKQVHAGEEIQVSGITSVFIINNSLGSKKFLVRQGICQAELMLIACSVNENLIQLNDGGYFNLASLPKQKMVWSNANLNGYFSVYTEVSDIDNGNTVYATNDSVRVKVVE